MENIQDALIDPHANVKISLMVSSKSYEDFEKLYKNLIRTSLKVSDVEMLVKTDDPDKRYFRLLNESPFHFKILNYLPYYKGYSNHLFFNELCKISHGKLIWPLYEDCEIVRGDWYKSLMKLVDYGDDIYNIAIPMDNGKLHKQICGANIITREWYNFFGIVSPFPNLDRWLKELSKEINRYKYFEEEELLSHFPKGNRTLSKKQRKELFYPMLEKYIKKFNKVKK